MHILSVITSDVLIAAIEEEQRRLGHNLTNKELNDLVNKLIQEGKAALLAAQKDSIDSDVLTGNLREEGLKVVNLSEEVRRNDASGDSGKS